MTRAETWAAAAVGGIPPLEELRAPAWTRDRVAARGLSLVDFPDSGAAATLCWAALAISGSWATPKSGLTTAISGAVPMQRCVLLPSSVAR